MKKSYDEDKLQKDVIKYMEKKYDEKFMIRNCGAGDTTYNFRLIAEEHKDWEDVYAKWNYKEKKFSDNYMSWYFRDELSQRFQSICREVYSNCIAINTPMGVQTSDQYSIETTFDEYNNAEGISAYNLFVVDDSEKKESDLLSLCNILNQKKEDVDLTIVYVTQDTLDSIDYSNYKKVFEEDEYTWRTEGFIFYEKPSSEFKWRNVN